jgi:PhnB protein
MQVNPYLSYKGQCEEAFIFYEKCFGGRITAKTRYGETSMSDQVPAGWRDKIIFSSMTLGDMVLMGGDPPPARYTEPKGFSLTVELDDPAEAEQIFTALSENGSVTVPLEQSTWADRFGVLTDQFGIPWMVMYRKTA